MSVNLRKRCEGTYRPQYFYLHCWGLNSVVLCVVVYKRNIVIELYSDYKR